MSKQKVLIVSFGVILIAILVVLFWPVNKKHLNVKSVKSLKTEYPVEHAITAPSIAIKSQTGVPTSTTITELNPTKTIPLPKNIQNVVFNERTGEPSVYVTNDHLEFLNNEGKVKKKIQITMSCEYY